MRSVLSALVVAVAGFILLNLTFFFFYTVSLMLKMLIIPDSTPSECPWFMPVSFAVSTVIIGLVSWFVFRSGLATIFKATYMVVPVAVILVLIGIALYPWPIVPYLVNGLLTMGVLVIFFVPNSPGFTTTV